jgi:hypothetical protein
MARFYHLKHSAERLKIIRDKEKMKSAGARQDLQRKQEGGREN